MTLWTRHKGNEWLQRESVPLNWKGATAQNGKDYAGKTVIIALSKDNTRCTSEACGFRDVHAVAGMNGSLGEQRQFEVHDRLSGFGLPFVLLSDPEAKTMEAYGAFGEK
jgi:peroxiredoxin Q/BCP